MSYPNLFFFQLPKNIFIWPEANNRVVVHMAKYNEIQSFYSLISVRILRKKDNLYG